MSDLVSHIVSDLEKNFDNVDEKFHATATFSSTWKSDALSMTYSEIPKMNLTGLEVGSKKGFGSVIYSAADSDDEVDNKVKTTKSVSTCFCGSFSIYSNYPSGAALSGTLYITEMEGGSAGHTPRVDGPEPSAQALHGASGR